MPVFFYHLPIGVVRSYLKFIADNVIAAGTLTTVSMTKVKFDRLAHELDGFCFALDPGCRGGLES